MSRTFRLAPLLVPLVLVGCASNPEKRLEVARQEVSRMAPPTRPLSSFALYEIEPIEIAPDVRDDEKKTEYAHRLQEMLEERIAPLLASWQGDARQGEGTLLLQAHLASLRIVSGGARFWAGGLAGDSNIDLDLVLRDAATGEVLARPRIEQSSSGISGGWSMGATDQNLLLYVVDIAHEYLAANY